MASEERRMSSSGESLYVVMGLEKTASADDIKRAYRRLALQWHPDKNMDDLLAAEKFTEVYRAYAILGDVNRRGLYDNYGSVGLYLIDRLTELFETSTETEGAPQGTEQEEEETGFAYFKSMSGWRKALFIFCGVITGCYFCCCCCCCFNYCCGKCKPKDSEDTEDYQNIQNDSSDEESENHSDNNSSEPQMPQPQQVFAMPPPPTCSSQPSSFNATETTPLKPDETIQFAKSSTAGHNLPKKYGTNE